MTTAPILTVTLNPALDVSTTTPQIHASGKLRCAAPEMDAGGGGINVARAIGILGGDASAFVALGGFTGDKLLSLLKDEPLVPVVFPIEGDTRQSVAVLEDETAAQYRFVMPGPQWTPQMAETALGEISAHTQAGGYVVLSGSQPPGVPVHFPTDLAALLEAIKARIILDTSGAPLRAAAQIGAARKHVLRLDGAESEMLAGRKITSLDALADFAQSLVSKGMAEAVVLALGPQGSVLAQGSDRWHANTIDVPVRSKVGAGDSFVGAFTLALARGADWPDALVQGAGAASAAVMTEASALCRRADQEALASSATLRRI
jgi:6-phosphofructokinase 2